MATLKGIRLRIVSVKNTQQLTKAMKMVSASKLRRAEQAAKRNMAYAEKLKQIMHSAKTAGAAEEHFAFHSNPIKKALVVIFTTDKGLCGGLNNQLCKLAEQRLKTADFAEAQLYTIGRKGRDFFETRAIPAEHVVVSPEELMPKLDELSAQWLTALANSEFTHLYVGFNTFKSIIQQEPKIEQVFPIPAVEPTAELSAEKKLNAENLFEPDLTTVLNHLVPLYLKSKLHEAWVVNQASEHAARMVAMDAATNNAHDLQSALQLQYNRLRQAAITTELMEIISGAESIS